MDLDVVTSDWRENVFLNAFEPSSMLSCCIFAIASVRWYWYGGFRMWCTQEENSVRSTNECTMNASRKATESGRQTYEPQTWKKPENSKQSTRCVVVMTQRAKIIPELWKSVEICDCKSIYANLVWTDRRSLPEDAVSHRAVLWPKTSRADMEMRENMPMVPHLGHRAR